MRRKLSGLQMQVALTRPRLVQDLTQNTLKEFIFNSKEVGHNMTESDLVGST